MKAHAIIGANYGDEGKGLMTDYICDKVGADVVIRFNGGAQAGHTVVTPQGQRHVFHHYGSGSFLDIPTFLSKFFLVNPIVFSAEARIGSATVFVDPGAIVTTPWDMLVNQAIERQQERHGSCGVGINETMRRSKIDRFRLTVANMLDAHCYQRIAHEYIPKRIAELGLSLTIEPHWDQLYHHAAQRFLNLAKITDALPGCNIVFEGAQGLLLDQNAPDFPHVTHSNTGMKNVLRLCRDFNVLDLQITYVTRSYLTRHGVGPLPREEPLPDFVRDDTNISNEFQGALRYAKLDVQALEQRIIKDANGGRCDIAVTCLDQYDEDVIKKFSMPVAYASRGRTRADVEAR